MTQYTFPSTGISLNEVIKAVGIETIERDGVKYLVHGGKEIERPPHQRLEEKVKEHFNIEISYTD